MSMSKCLTVLVTGGAGYIGSHTVLELLVRGHQVIATDSCVNAVENNVEGGKPPAIERVEKLSGKTSTFYKVSTLEKSELAKIFSQVN